MSLQLSSEQSVGDVGITQLDWKRVPQARSRSCESSVTITTECCVLSDTRWQSSASDGYAALTAPQTNLNAQLSLSLHKQQMPFATGNITNDVQFQDISDFLCVNALTG